MQYACHWLGVGVTEATRRGYHVIDLVDAEATYETLKRIMDTEQIDVAIMGGHGNASTFTGHEQQVVMQACVNDQVMSGTISHFLSCSVGQELLPSIIEKKGVWTIGYMVDFNFMVDTNYMVEQDPFAEPFKDVTVTIIGQILDGARLKSAWDAGIAKCDEWIARLWDRTEPEWGDVISCLQHNRDGMIALGDEEAYVMPRPVIAGIPTALTLALGVIAIAWYALKG